MSKIIDNGNGTTTLPTELLHQLVKEYQQTKTEVETTVDTVARMLQILGIVTKEGKIKEGFRFRDIVRPLSGIISDAVINSDALTKKFSFIGDPKCIAVIEKYSYLYAANPTAKEKNIVDTEFEML